MTPAAVFVRHDAELDALGYFQYLHDHNPEAAFRFLRALDGTIEGGWRCNRSKVSSVVFAAKI